MNMSFQSNSFVEVLLSLHQSFLVQVSVEDPTVVNYEFSEILDRGLRPPVDLYNMSSVTFRI